MSTPADLRKARREITVSVVLLVAALVVMTLALRGTFNSMWFFPHIFGAIVSVLAVISLLPARRTLRKPRLLLALAIIAAAASTPSLHVRAVMRQMEAYERRVSDALAGTPAPPIPFVRAIGLDETGPGSIELGGRLTLLNFWATWCDPCVEEVPIIEEFWRRHQDSGILVVGVTTVSDSAEVDEETHQVTAFLQRLDVTYPVLIADEESPAHAAYRVESLPSSILVDPNGSVLAFGAGVRGTVRLMRQAEQVLNDR